MYGFLLALLILDGILLTVVILLQAGKGGGLAAMGGGAATEGIMAGRQATTVLTRATWIMGSSFMVLAFILSILSSRARQPSSILEGVAPVSAPAPILPSEGGAGVDILPGGGDPQGGGTDSQDPGDGGI